MINYMIFIWVLALIANMEIAAIFNHHRLQGVVWAVMEALTLGVLYILFNILL